MASRSKLEHLKTRLALVFLSLAFVLSACYRPSHSAEWHGSLGYGYQFDEPKDYCRQSWTDLGLEMYCPEGKIEIEFVNQSHAGGVNDMLTNMLSEIPSPSKYSLSELQGKGSVIALAELKNDKQVSQSNYPSYIAVFLFDAERMVVARGFLYKPEFEDSFQSAFRTIITTLEPYEIESGSE
jgi:hypothetical protein